MSSYNLRLFYLHMTYSSPSGHQSTTSKLKFILSVHIYVPSQLTHWCRTISYVIGAFQSYPYTYNGYKECFCVDSFSCWPTYPHTSEPKYLRHMFKYNHDLHVIKDRLHDRLHHYRTSTSGARNVVRQPSAGIDRNRQITSISNREKSTCKKVFKWKLFTIWLFQTTHENNSQLVC